MKNQFLFYPSSSLLIPTYLTLCTYFTMYFTYLVIYLVLTTVHGTVHGQVATSTVRALQCSAALPFSFSLPLTFPPLYLISDLIRFKESYLVVLVHLARSELEGPTMLRQLHTRYYMQIVSSVQYQEQQCCHDRTTRSDWTGPETDQASRLVYNHPASTLCLLSYLVGGSNRSEYRLLLPETTLVNLSSFAAIQNYWYIIVCTLLECGGMMGQPP